MSKDTRLEDQMSKYGDRIKRLRNQKGLKLSELAERSGLSEGYISNVENGNKRPTETVVVRIARALGLGIEEELKQAQLD